MFQSAFISLEYNLKAENREVLLEKYTNLSMKAFLCLCKKILTLNSVQTLKGAPSLPYP
jgi:hypothetical protein